jgi:SpoVK/Ycf46/Vps4 family AAA+-type ATPase
MSLSAKNEAYRNYIEQAKEAYALGDIKHARGLFIKAAEITNQITMEQNNPEIRSEYHRVTKTIIEFVKQNCSNVIKSPKTDKNESGLNPINVEPNEDISLEDALMKLQSLIGIENVKNTIDEWVAQIQIFKVRKQHNLAQPEMSYHMVFTGNPGTGKTTVARIISQIYKALGIFSKGHLVEVERPNLVAEYVGQTAIKTQAVIEQAIGGVLFIDEAYTLSKGGSTDFGREAIETLLTAMTNKANQFAIIVAGYEDLMEEFIKSNPGLMSRFKTSIKFEDFSGEELFDIFNKFCLENDYKIAEGSEDSFRTYFNKLYDHRNEDFGNGRDVRNIFEKAITNQSKRLSKIINLSIEDLMTIHLEDLPYTISTRGGI